MHAFPRLRGFKTLLGEDLDPLGVLVDIARMEKGKRESGAVALTDQLKKRNCTRKHFIG